MQYSWQRQQKIATRKQTNYEEQLFRLCIFHWIKRKAAESETKKSMNWIETNKQKRVVCVKKFIRIQNVNFSVIFKLKYNILIYFHLQSIANNRNTWIVFNVSSKFGTLWNKYETYCFGIQLHSIFWKPFQNIASGRDSSGHLHEM